MSVTLRNTDSVVAYNDDIDIMENDFSPQVPDEPKPRKKNIKKSVLGKRVLVIALITIFLASLAIGSLYLLSPFIGSMALTHMGEAASIFISSEQSAQNYTKGAEAFELENWGDAIVYFRGVGENTEHYKSAQQKLELALIYEASQDNFNEAKEAIDENKWDEALNLLSLIPENTEHYGEAQLLSENARIMAISAESLKTGMEMFQNNELDKAQLLLEQVNENDPGYVTALNTIDAINNARASYYLSAARLKMNAGDFEGARTDLSLAENYVPDMSPSLELERQIEQTAIDLLFEEIRNDARNFSYDELKENAARLLGRRIRLRGKVTGVSENSSIVMFVNMTYTGNIWRDRVAVYYHAADDIDNGEIITVYGTIRGFYDLSQERLIPAIGAELIE